MSDRILNFSEFFGKYSKQSNKENSLETVTSAPQNFEDGFDETTYDKTELGPNKPISQTYQEKPVNPGEKGAPKFNVNKDENMEAPDETEDTPEPEKMGANPEKEKVSESRILSFDRFNKKFKYSAKNESVDLAKMDDNQYREYNFDEEDMDFGANPYSDEDEEYCQECGLPTEESYIAAANPGMKTCGCNPSY